MAEAPLQVVERDFGELAMHMGPQHPSTHGVLRLTLRLRGETVVAADPGIGFLHRGVEKLSESLGWEQLAPVYERDDYPLVSSGVQLRPTAYATGAVIEPVGECRPTWQILDDITRRMGLGGCCPNKEVEAAAESRGRRPTPSDVIDAMLKAGAMPHLTVGDLVSRHPHGVALRDGLPVGRLTEVLQTPDGTVQLFSSQLQSEVVNLRAYVEPDEEWPLRLIGRREKGSQNTWMHNSSVIYGDDYQFRAHVNPIDAAECHAVEDDIVVISSAVGSVEIQISIVESVGAGVVSVPHGWGHRSGSARHANAIGGVNSNELVDHNDVEALAGMSILNGIPVRMERVGARAGSARLVGSRSEL